MNDTRIISLTDPADQDSQYYLPFWEVTVRALRFVCLRMGVSLLPANEKTLMDQYAKLSAFDDSLAVLKSLKQKRVCYRSRSSRHVHNICRYFVLLATYDIKVKCVVIISNFRHNRLGGDSIAYKF